MTKLIVNETWRLLLDAEAYSMFSRCVQFRQTKKVQWLDLMQLPYLSLGRKRILVTNDVPLFNAARAILPGRYQNAQVTTLSDFLA